MLFYRFLFFVISTVIVYDIATARTPPRPPVPPYPGKQAKYNCSAPRVFADQPGGGVVCTSTYASYFFNSSSKQCEEAGDIGCGRTKNNFPDLDTCEKHCVEGTAETFAARTSPVRPVYPKPVHPRPNQAVFIPAGQRYDCSEPRVSENQPTNGIICTSTHASYFYNSSSLECEDAGEIGCGRTKNNFPTLESCKQHCLHQTEGGPSRTSPPRYPPPEYHLYRPRYNCSAPRIFANQPEGLQCSSPPSYFYNSTAEECQDAGEIGCGRTENNFPDLETCEEHCPSQGGNCDKSSCPWYLWKHYTERGCEPIYEPEKCCPVQFDCPQLDLNATHCLHRGKIYEASHNELVEVANSCQMCHCLPAYADQPYATISCLNIECAENFGVRRRPEEGCQYVYEQGKCCRVKKCGEELNLGARADVTCTYKGKTYKDGQTIEYKGRPCHRCVCSKDYNGTDGPGCYDIGCGLDTALSNIRAACTPKYTENSCCVIDWVCHPENTGWKTYNEICKLPLDTGLKSCTEFSIRHYYDSHLGRCQKFNYTGCIGNMNNFKQLKNCESLCEKPDLCTLPPVTEKCEESEVTKYHFNVKTGQCEEFSYGGCEGNGNIFDSVEDCTLKCGTQLQQRSLSQVDICQMKPDKGPCDEEVTRYSYNSDTNECESFTYGNCKGNGNNFGTEDECMSYCQNKTLQLEEGLTCMFGNYKFPIGHSLKTYDKCTSCTCTTPPLFTCVKKRCYPPKADRGYIFCTAHKVPGQCCPEYHCLRTMEEVCKYFRSCSPDETCELSGPPEKCVRDACHLTCEKKNQEPDA